MILSFGKVKSSPTFFWKTSFYTQERVFKVKLICIRPILICLLYGLMRKIKYHKTIQNHFTPNNVAIIKKKRNNIKCWWGSAEIGALMHCLGDECSTLEKFGILQNVKWRVKLPHDPGNSLLLKEMKICPLKILNVYNIIFHNSPKVETTQCPSTDDEQRKCGICTQWNFIQP